MTDKELIKQEIKRRIESINSCPFKTAELGSEKFNEGELSAFNDILDFIDSLQEESTDEANYTTKDEDLDKLVISLEETIGTSPHSREVIKEHLQKAAEWQKNKMKEVLQTEYEKGRFDMREEMMKDAVEAFVNTYENTDDGNYVEFVTEQSPCKFKELEKCKLIIIKEEQQ